MSSPKIENKAGSYYFDWQEEKLTIKVSRIKTHSDGRVIGEVLIETTLPGIKQHIHQAQFNFSSTSTRDRLGMSLEKQYPSLFDWPRILESLAFHILEKSREGEPVIDLDIDTELKPPEYYLEPIIIKGCANVIYGEKEQGKSTIAQIATVCLIKPWSTVLDFISPDQTVNTLYLDWEAEPNIALYNFKRLCTGHGLSGLKFPYLHCGLPLADDMEKINNIIDQRKIEVLIIDSMGLAAGTKLSTDEPAIRLFQALRQLRITSLIIGQTAKNQEGKKSLYGSTFFEYLARNIWQVKATVDKDRINCGLFHEKANYTRRHRPIGIEICHYEDSILLDRCEIETIPELLERMGWEARITEVLKDGSLTVVELCEELNISKQEEQNIVKSFLTRMKAKNKVMKLGDKKWGLVFAEKGMTA